MSSLPVSKTGALSPNNGASAKLPSAKDASRAPLRALLQRKLEEIVVLTAESTSADGVAIALREDGKFTCRASQGFAPEPGVVVEPGQGVCGRCIIDARVLVCQDLSGDIKSAVAAPVIVGDEIEGLIATFSFRQGAFSSDHIDLVSRTAVDIGNQVASPETIHLVPRDSFSIWKDPRADVIALDDVEPTSREKHLEVLGAVTAPSLPAVSPPNTIAEPDFPVDATSDPVNTEPELPSIHFLGYETAPLAEPDSAAASNQMLGEYLSKWDVVVIFGAILIAMLAFSLWVHHRRAQPTQPYTAQYAPESVSDQPPAPTLDISSTSADATRPGSDSKADARPKMPARKVKTGATDQPIAVAGGRAGLVGDELKPPPLSAAPIPSTAIPNVDISAAATPAGPTAPAELVHKVNPVYPTEARVGGVVTLDLRVDINGRVGIIKVINGSNPFVSSALNAVRQWRYEPAVQNGRKIESTVRVDVPFNPASQ